ncbi:MAG TPA: hypothetical protein VGW80_04725 [Solirubrobacterales bacterium]|nr:hypothetical protein [Solirubrobacterales bacterium]
MSELGEISAELNEALGRLERLLRQLAELDRVDLAPLQAELSRRPDGRRAAALIDRARQLLRQASEGTVAARRAGGDWLAQHGSSHAGHSAGFEISGGRAYLPPQQSGHRTAAAALPDFPGEYTFVAHGAGEQVFVADEPLSAPELAELIESDPGWNHKPVRLFCCETGCGEAQVAQEVARLLGVKVTAPDGIAWCSADGRYGVYPIEVKIVGGEVVEVWDKEAEGEWREFHPG